MSSMSTYPENLVLMIMSQRHSFIFFLSQNYFSVYALSHEGTPPNQYCWPGPTSVFHHQAGTWLRISQNLHWISSFPKTTILTGQDHLGPTSWLVLTCVGVESMFSKSESVKTKTGAVRFQVKTKTGTVQVVVKTKIGTIWVQVKTETDTVRVWVKMKTGIVWTQVKTEIGLFLISFHLVIFRKLTYLKCSNDCSSRHVTIL